MNDTNKEPFTVGLKPSSKLSITLGDLIAAVAEYLQQKYGIRVGSYSFDQDWDAQTTTVKFRGVNLPDGTTPIDNMLRFDVTRICTRCENAHLGGNPRTIAVWRKNYSTGDYSRKFQEWYAKYDHLQPSDWQPMPLFLETFADLVAEPNADHSITFFIVDRWEANTAHYRRPNALSGVEEAAQCHL